MERGRVMERETERLNDCMMTAWGLILTAISWIWN